MTTARINLIEAQWEVFAEFMFDRDTPQVQRDEMRMAFYAGIWNLWQVIERVLDRAKTDPAVWNRMVEIMRRDTAAFFKEMAEAEREALGKYQDFTVQ